MDEEEIEDSVLDNLMKKAENTENTEGIAVEPVIVESTKKNEMVEVKTIQEIEAIEDLSLPEDFHKKMKVCVLRMIMMSLIVVLSSLLFRKILCKRVSALLRILI